MLFASTMAAMSLWEGCCLEDSAPSVSLVLEGYLSLLVLLAIKHGM